MERKGFSARMMEFFGKLPGQSMLAFSAELKALTPADKRWFCDQFNANGMPTDYPKESASASA